MGLRYVWSELVHRPQRSIVAIISIALGVALYLSLQAYAEGYQNAARTPLTEIGADLVVQREGDIPDAFEGIVFPHSTAPIGEEEVAALREVEGVEEVGEALFFWSFESDPFLVGLGIDPEESFGPGRLRTAIREGRFLEAGDTGVAVADSSYADQYQLQIGDTVQISGEAFQLVGLADTSRVGNVANANLYLPIADVNRMVHAAPQVQSVYTLDEQVTNLLFVKADSAQASLVADNLKQLLGERSLVTTPQSFEDVFGTTFQLIDRFGLLVGFSCLFLALLGLLRVVVGGLTERRRDVGIMRAVGWRKREIVRQISRESLVLVAVGWSIGVIAAIGIAYVLSYFTVSIPVPWELSPTPHFMAGGAKSLALTVTMQASVQPLGIAGTGVLCLLAGWVLSWWLARRAANMKPVEVLRSE